MYVIQHEHCFSTTDIIFTVPTLILQISQPCCLHGGTNSCRVLVFKLVQTVANNIRFDNTGARNITFMFNITLNNLILGITQKFVREDVLLLLSCI